jgi:hypothetical protein
MKKKLLAAVDNIMIFIFIGVPSTKTATQAKITSEIQKATKKLRHDIKQQDVIISQYQAVLAELNAITGNMKGSSNLKRVVCELQTKANTTQKLDWSRAPNWANVLLCGNEVVVWAVAFKDNAEFIQFENFSKGHQGTFNLSLVEGHSWHLLAVRPTR